LTRAPFQLTKVAGGDDDDDDDDDDSAELK
jgi:hypothetical protein